jgi:hypothetical protein
MRDRRLSVVLFASVWLLANGEAAGVVSQFSKRDMDIDDILSANSLWDEAEATKNETQSKVQSPPIPQSDTETFSTWNKGNARRKTGDHEKHFEDNQNTPIESGYESRRKSTR